MPFDFLKPPLLALDIGSSSIKMVELMGKAVSKNLKSFHVDVLPQGLVHDGAIQDVGPFQECLNRIAKSVKGKERRVALTLGGSTLMIKRVPIQLGKDIVIEEQIPYHAEQAFQLDPSTLYFDWVALPPRPDRPESTDVMLVGARREIVEQYVTCVREAGFRVGVIECSAFSVANIFEHNYGMIEGLVALISVGASHTQISFVLDGVFQFSRDIPIGGEVYTRRIMETMSQPFETAESLKLAASIAAGGPSQEVAAVFAEINEQVVHDLSSTTNYYLQSGEAPPGAVLKYAFLTGGAGRTPGLDAAIAAGLQAAVYQLNPFQRININDRKFPMDHIVAVGSVLSVAAGLALRTYKDKE